MFPLEGITQHSCSGYRDRPAHTILYSILSGSESRYLNGKLNRDATAHTCHCEQRRTVRLKDPKATGQVASGVLVNTVCFVRGLPSFSQLPSGDQSSLLRHCWVSLFVLGLAQKKVVFEVTEVANTSILRKILLGPGLTGHEADLPTLAEVHNLRACLHKLWNLDLGPVEYAYLKGALVFNPAVQGLSALRFIEGLRRKGLGALQEVLHRLHPEDAARFTHVLLAASTIQTVSHGLVAQLFFKPVIGNTNMFRLLTEMLSVQ